VADRLAQTWAPNVNAQHAFHAASTGTGTGTEQSFDGDEQDCYWLVDPSN